MKKMKMNFGWGKGPKQALIVTIAVLGCIILLHFLTEMSRNIELIAYSDFMHKVESAEIKNMVIEGQEARGVYKNGNRFQVVIPPQGFSWQYLQDKGIEFSFANPADYGYFWYFIICLLFLGIILTILYFMRQKSGSGSGGSNIFNMGKSKARIFMPSTIKETFASVAGAHEAKEELQDLVDFLKNPKKYRRLGAKITKGVLLVGEPGNGKTLLARAVAGEANCPFLSISASEFIEVFVGVGAARVHDLFEQARKHAPSIIFIDEIDAVGRHRGTGLGGGGNDEREQTLNQLLTEMDGFQVNDLPVIVIAATNRPDVLDKALLRPGRFDHRVEVPFPNQKSREEILKVHAQHIKLDGAVDLVTIARGTPGFSGADLANLINEAARIASKTEADMVTMQHFEEARDKVMLGKETKSIMLSEEDKKVIAYHESGHALAGLLLPEYSDPLHKITIIPRGRALGVTHSLPEREKYITSKEEMEATVISALGGRVAEEIMFNRLTTGAYSDFQKASSIVRAMVCKYGMVPEELGTILYNQDPYEYQYSPSTAEKIDKAVKMIMDNCYIRTRELLQNNKDKLDLLATTLLQKETMYAQEVYDLLGITPRAYSRFVQEKSPINVVPIENHA